MNKEYAASEWFEGTVVPKIEDTTFMDTYRPLLVKLKGNNKFYIGYYFVLTGKPAVWKLSNGDTSSYNELIEKWAIINH